MIPIEYLWYIIGAVSVPVFIKIYLKALKRNREDKARVVMRRKRFDRIMKSPAQTPSKSESRNRTKSPVPMPQPASERIASAVENPASERIKPTVKPVEHPTEGHWLRGVKLPPKREKSKHWLENIKSKRSSSHWLEYLRR